jgi:RNA polymerase-interacting CarD/CdnL/TRCF family regulator
MRMRWLPAVLVLGCVWAGPLRADLKPALAEPNLGKRSKLALDNAAAALKAARDAYSKGDNEKVAAVIDEIQQSVELAFDSLMKTGKNPRNSPRWFKPAEMATRDLSKKLDTFQRDMDYADRAMLDQVKTRVQQVHDELLLGLMEGKRK